MTTDHQAVVTEASPRLLVNSPGIQCLLHFLVWICQICNPRTRTRAEPGSVVHPCGHFSSAERTYYVKTLLSSDKRSNIARLSFLHGTHHMSRCPISVDILVIHSVNGRGTLQHPVQPMNRCRFSYVVIRNVRHVVT